MPSKKPYNYGDFLLPYSDDGDACGDAFLDHEWVDLHAVCPAYFTTPNPGGESDRIEHILTLAWKGSHRYYHGLYHLHQLRYLIEVYAKNGGDKLSVAVLTLAALFHDVVYNPLYKDGKNENLSLGVFTKCSNPQSSFDKEVHDLVIQCILASKSLSVPDKDSHPVVRMFWDMDNWFWNRPEFGTALECEELMFKEFQVYSYQDYVKGRRQFLSNLANSERHKAPGLEDTIRDCKHYLDNRTRNIGIYAGSFNPFHVGHQSVLRQAEMIFDKVIVAQGQNESKTQERLYNIQDVLPFHETMQYACTLPELIERLPKENVTYTLVRGIRDGEDLREEKNLTHRMNDFYPDLVKAVYFTSQDTEHISSSFLRGMQSKKHSRSLSRYIVSPPVLVEKLFGLV